jgi:rhodanese-related sulfurtransferase
MDATVSISGLAELLRAFPPPTLIDARASTAFTADDTVIPGALRIAREELAARTATLEPWRPVVVYAGEQEEAPAIAASLRACGFDARALEGGIYGWRAAGGPTVCWTPPTRWVTRERPKIDRIACPWLIRRFLDTAAEFFYVPAAEVHAFAVARGAVPFDVPDADYGHAGPRCSFDAFIRRHALADPALDDLATIVRGADTGALDLAPQAPGLLATSLGLSRLCADDHAMLHHGLLVYDALYAWCRQARGETHDAGAATPRAAAAR